MLPFSIWRAASTVAVKLHLLNLIKLRSALGWELGNGRSGSVSYYSWSPLLDAIVRASIEMLGVKYVMLGWGQHNGLLTAQPGWGHSEVQSVSVQTNCVAPGQTTWSLQNARTWESVSGCPDPSARVTRRHEWWHEMTEAGPRTLPADPGAPTSRGRHRVIIRWDGLIWTVRSRHRDIAVYCVLTIILQTRHYLSLAQTPDTRDSFDAISEIPLIYILNSLNLLSLKWTQNKNSAIKKRLSFYNI